VAPRPVARGPRVFLRPVSAADEDEFLERVRASRVLHRPWSYPPETAEAFDEFVHRQRRPTSRGLLVCRNEDGGIAGWFGVSQIFHGPFKSAFLGYYAFVPHAGKGYMREGLDLVVRHAFDDLRLHRLQASIQPANERSIALVRGAGFTKEGYGRRYLKIGGRWRDHEHWIVLADDPRIRRRT
jgi:[ribosomal protein S5]-alanine N-acetyltransferase